MPSFSHTRRDPSRFSSSVLSFHILILFPFIRARVPPHCAVKREGDSFQMQKEPEKALSRGTLILHLYSFLPEAAFFSICDSLVSPFPSPDPPLFQRCTLVQEPSPPPGFATFSSPPLTTDAFAAYNNLRLGMAKQDSPHIHFFSRLRVDPVRTLIGSQRSRAPSRSQTR